MTPTNNDLSTLIGLLSVIGIPLLSLVFSQKSVVIAITRLMLWMVNRLRQDKIDRPADPPTDSSGNGGVITHQATLLAFSEGSKRVDIIDKRADTIEDGLEALKRDMAKAFDEFGERMRIRLDGDLLTNNRKFKATNERIDHLTEDMRSMRVDVEDLKDWRGKS